MLESLFNKAASKKRLTQVLSCEICEIFNNTYFEEQKENWYKLPISQKFCCAFSFEKAHLKTRNIMFKSNIWTIFLINPKFSSPFLY